ncbi:site-2 protease family protein [Candidatus Peregrinibacteria bacterium]|nr:site-2 protease family protein [Candidatus Peregrinibacteria bacterium]MBI4129427.1 site-2 protease family protein [Candidatus Peregrinibacteria bacterium]
MTPFLRPTYIIAVLIAIAVHECAHAYAAYRLGDDTAKDAGRLTLNPLAHIDPMGALLFLVVGFGWAKPVPVDPARLGSPKRDNALVALAGPASNLLLAFIAFVGLLLVGISWRGSFDLLSLHGASVPTTFLLQLFGSSLFVNLSLMAFNLFPIAPLDGSKILEGFIPYRHELAYERFMRHGPYILLGLLLFESFLPFPILSGWVFGISDTVLGIFETVAALAQR